MKKLLLLLGVLPVAVSAGQADHLILNKIAIAPTAAEMVIIQNPTDTAVNLADYYITDATNGSDDKFYYHLPSFSDYWSGGISDFIARFPDMDIPAGGSVTLSMHSSDIYQSYYGESPDLALFGDMLNAEDGVNTISLGPAFNNIDMLNTIEMLMLFHWDGLSSTVEDVDYFLWGAVDPSLAIDKTGVPGYADDTPIDDQYFMPSISNDMIYTRSSPDEASELTSGGNGITGHDETSEDFETGWRIVYNPGLVTPLADIYDEQYAVGDELIVQGLIVEFRDIRPSNGPQIITIQDADDYQLSLTVWDWDVVLSEIGYMVDNDNLSEYVIQVRGVLDFYLGWQLTVASPDDIIVYSVDHPDGQFVEGDFVEAAITPAPYVIIPTLGERLDFSYSFPANSRVIVRVFDLSGRFITTLVDKYFESSGTVLRDASRSDWDGRDHLGGIVPPGTYILHIEASNFQSGKTTNASAPVVVGVRF
ncbi:MAG: hypothetical protein GXO91_01205 [FCB group bacterium]|nr:hypothetical protein [FCB group bacterium]